MRRLGIVVLFLIVCFVNIQSKTYVVSVGIADYPGIKNDLRISDNDAKVVGKVFKASKETSVSVLVNAEATYSTLLRTVQNSFANALSGDAAVLYFSGHGVPGALVCHDGFLPYQRLFGILKSCRAQRKIIIVDACFSGKMRNNKKTRSNNYNSQSVMFFLSSRTNEPSQETQYKNSLFTIFLERGLRGGADKNRDRKITAREIYDFVHSGVINASGNKQHPVMWGKFDDNMTIINW